MQTSITKPTSRLGNTGPPGLALGRAGCAGLDAFLSFYVFLLFCCSLRFMQVVLAVEEQYLVPPDGSSDNGFGDSTVISEDGRTIAVGASLEDNVNGERAGEVYLWKRDADKLEFQQKLLADDGAAFNYFGSRLGINNGTLVVVATRRFDSNNSGAVYVFSMDEESSEWNQVQKLTSDSGRGWFGTSVDIDNNTLIVGEEGAVQVFTRESSAPDARWNEQQTLLDENFVSDYSRLEIAISGETIVVGLPTNVYVFVRTESTWTQQHKLWPENIQCEYCSTEVDISGDGTIVVGYPISDQVYVFNTSDWATWEGQQLEYYPSTLYIEDFFLGASVKILGDRILVGSYAGAFLYIRSESGDSWTVQDERFAQYFIIDSLDIADDGTFVAGEGTRSCCGGCCQGFQGGFVVVGNLLPTSDINATESPAEEATTTPTSQTADPGVSLATESPTLDLNPTQSPAEKATVMPTSQTADPGVSLATESPTSDLNPTQSPAEKASVTPTSQTADPGLSSDTDSPTEPSPSGSSPTTNRNIFIFICLCLFQIFLICLG